MIGRRNRFHGLGALRRVYQRGRNVRGGYMSLKFSQRGPERPYRVAVVVSRKVHKSAVKRNRIRRRIYEQVRLNEENIKPGTDLVITVFSDRVLDLPAEDLRHQLTDLLKKTA